MSQENVELVRRGYEMYASGDLEGLVTLIAPDAELADAGGLGITGTASGTPEDFTALRNFVLVSARLRGQGRASGVPLDAVVFQLGS